MYTLLKSAKRYRRIPRTLITVLAIWAGSPFANDSFKNFQVHGFLNQGYFLSSDNNVYGSSSDSNGSFGLTEIGINGSARLFNNFGFAVQGIYRHAGEVSDGARIDFALIDWTMIERENYQMGIRLGRIKNPLGFYNETRDVAFTRPSIALPGIYRERSRNLFLSSDGGQFYWNHTSSIGDFSLQLNAGNLDDDLDVIERNIFSFAPLGKLDPKPSYMGKLEFENIEGSTRLAFSYANVEMDYEPATADLFSAGDIAFELYILSLQQRIGEDITLTSEYLRTYNSIKKMGPRFPDNESISESYYIQGDYQFHPHFRGTIRYDVSYNNIDDRDGERYATLTGNPDYAAYTKDFMFGLRWTPKNNWMIQAEYHKINGVSKLSYAENPDRSETEQYWDLFALQVSYRF